MSPSSISFIVWGVVMLGVLAWMVVIAIRGKSVQDKAEDVAARALPEIGNIAEKKHAARFGCAPANSRTATGTWYPHMKKDLKGSVR